MHWMLQTSNWMQTAARLKAVSCTLQSHSSESSKHYTASTTMQSSNSALYTLTASSHPPVSADNESSTNATRFDCSHQNRPWHKHHTDSSWCVACRSN